MSAPAIRIYDQVAVVIPARNERASLPGCLRATLTAALCVPIPVVIVVVLDASDDGSAELAGQYGPDVHFVSVDVRNVGAARAVGFGYARSLYDQGIQCWFATTDADTRVEPRWLVHQLNVGADMVLGPQHVHGANMGFSARAYWRVGGFSRLASGEDVDLVTRFEAAGYRVHRDTDLSVRTSARAPARAPRGFAHRLGDHRLDESRRTATGGGA
jgi:glycosyltransferase involved in cell wall biosynthesis